MGKKSSKTKSTTSLPKWAQGYAKEGAGMIMDTVRGNQGNLQAIADDVRGQLPQLQQMAFGPNANLDAADGYARDVLGGKFLNNNQYLDGMVNIARENVGNDVNSTFSRAGRTGGGNHAERLAQGMGNAELGLRYQNYGAERANQQQMAGLMPGLSAARYQGVAPWLAASQTAGQLPYAGLGSLASMGNLWAGQGTTTSTQPGGWGTQLLGAAASALPFVLSDPRSKTDVEKVGNITADIGLYEFSYKPEIGIAGRYRGVMADEIAVAAPEMLGPEVGGYMTVRYQPERIG